MPAVVVPVGAVEVLVLGVAIFAAFCWLVVALVRAARRP